MITLNNISLFLTLLSFLIMGILCFLDFRKNRPIKSYPKLSFIIPCYNDGNTIEQTIESIYANYDKDKLEVIVANDKSKDNSLEILKKLQKKYGFRLISNKVNMGKSKTLNNIYKLAKNETLFFLDADIILNKKAIDEIISRLQNDNIVAVSCPYQTSNPGFIPTMQTLDYNLFSFLQASYNNTSNISLWGGCLVIKKKAFQAVNLFSENMLCEDLELAFKLNKKGWKVQQCFTPVQTYVPKSFRTWYKQKIRWSSGAIQAILTHFRIWLSHPIQIIFLVIFSFLTLCSSIFLIKEILFLNVLWDNYQLINETLSAIASLKTVWLYYGSMILRDLLGRLYFSALTIPYVLPNIKSFKQVYKVLYVIPFSLLYYPALTVISLIGFAKGVRAYHRFKGGQRAW